MSFFGKKDGFSFEKKYKESYEKFKNTDGDGVFRVYAHGDYGIIWDDDTPLNTAEKFDNAMEMENPKWKDIDENKKAILILYVCRSASSSQSKEAIAKQISKSHPNLTVVAFKNYVVYNTPSYGITKVNLHQNRGVGGDGQIVFFKNGQELKGYGYSEFLKKHPGIK